LSADAGTIVLIGPGGVGKGTVARALVAKEPTLWLSRSWTTRPQRPSEHGDEYVFVSRPQFAQKVADGGFLEWAEFHGNLYGTPLPSPGDRRVLLEIEIQGAAQILAAEPDATVILLVPPSLEVLKDRLVERGDDATHVTTRLGSTPEELEIGHDLAGHVVINDNVERAVDEILSILGQPHRAR
jgi:guanylate kinase